MYKINAALWYHKMCRSRGLTPNYINIHIKDKTIQSQRTKEVAIRHRINQEIKFLYNKKRHINNQLYQAHLASANKWNNQWNITELSIEENLKHEMKNLLHYVTTL